jgi:hypothetical protein
LARVELVGNEISLAEKRSVWSDDLGVEIG